MVFKYLLIICILQQISFASIGDRSPFYQRCLDRCRLLNCTEGLTLVNLAENVLDGDEFETPYKQPLHLKVLLWSCPDECRYICMWKTVDAFHERNWKTPQFHGKWPFIRLFGIQEPASVAFSLLNLYVHVAMIKKFYKEVRPDSPLYWMWFGYCMICCHAWFWSSVFHSRDFPLTELFDYASAFSIVLVNCYVMLVRILRYVLPRFLLIVMTVFFIAFFVNHTIYLSMGKFDYAYNMQLNIAIGTFTAIGWFLWSVIKRYNQPYVWKCAMYVALTGFVLLLELVDRPPIYYIFDYHSLWHLTTAPLVFLIYSFAIDDCKYLRKIEMEVVKEEKHKTR